MKGNYRDLFAATACVLASPVQGRSEGLECDLAQGRRETLYTPAARNLHRGGKKRKKKKHRVVEPVLFSLFVH